MASETQYNLFKFLYEEEKDRTGELVNRSKIFLSITTIYLGFLAFKGIDLITTEISSFVSIMYLLSAAAFIGALLFTIRTFGGYHYEMATIPMTLIKEFLTELPTDDKFRDDRIADFAVATQRNFDQNRCRAKHLYCSYFCLITGIVIHLGGFAAALLFLFI